MRKIIVLFMGVMLCSATQARDKNDCWTRMRRRCSQNRTAIANSSMLAAAFGFLFHDAYQRRGDAQAALGEAVMVETLGVAIAAATQAGAQGVQAFCARRKAAMS